MDSTVRKHWDRTKTVTQNYAKLGLTFSLNGTAGGAAPDVVALEAARELENWSTVKDSEQALKQTLGAGQALVERDAEGNIRNVIFGEDVSDPEEMVVAPVRAKTVLVRELELRVEEAAKAGPRKWRMTESEKRWVSRLVDVYGEDYVGMSRDRKLNPRQQTPGELRKKCAAFREG